MLDRYLEWCAEIFGAAVESKLGQLVLFALGLFALGVFLSFEWGLASWALPVFLMISASMAARRVAVTRDELWRIACAPDAITRVRDASAQATGRTVATLIALREAVVALQSERRADAIRHLDHVDRRLLRTEETELTELVRARAREASPADDPLSSRLDRALVSRCWNEPPKLAALERAWARAGVTRSSLSTLPSLLRIRIDERRIADVEPAEARELAAEARAVGDEVLADDLDARARPGAYR